MEKINEIKKLQIYVIVFMVSIVLSVIFNFVAVPFVGLAVTALGLVTYILMWISFSKAGKLQLKSKNKYMVLMIFLTIITIITTAVTFYLSTKMTMELFSTTATLDATTIASNPEAMTALVEQTMPWYGKTMTILSGVEAAVNVLYLGMATMIFFDNKEEIKVAMDEHDSAYNQ